MALATDASATSQATSWAVWGVMAWGTWFAFRHLRQIGEPRKLTRQSWSAALPHLVLVVAIGCTAMAGFLIATA